MSIEKELAKKASQNKQSNEPEKKLGRNTDKTEACVTKLEEILRLDGTVSEACSYANIARQTYYRWLEEDEIFSDRMEDAKEYAFIQARRTINKAIKEGDGKLALDIMRRRDKRYKDKAESNLTGTVSLIELHGKIQKTSENGDGED